VTDGTRYFWEARYITTTFDASPKCLTEIDRFLRNEEGVLRTFTVKVDSSLDRSTTSTYKNPYF
jgi:ribosomal protein S6